MKQEASRERIQDALRDDHRRLDALGERLMNPVHVGDAVAALMKLMTHPAAIGQVFNIGNTEEVTILELAERIKAATGSSSRIVKIPYDQAYEAGFEDMPRRVPDLAKIHAAIGYTPQIGLDEIIRRVVSSMRASMNIATSA